jgi:hypothetical protein
MIKAMWRATRRSGAPSRRAVIAVCRREAETRMTIASPRLATDQAANAVEPSKMFLRHAVSGIEADRRDAGGRCRGERNGGRVRRLTFPRQTRNVFSVDGNRRG